MSIKSKIKILWQVFFVSIVSMNIFLLSVSLFNVWGIENLLKISFFDLMVSFLILICFIYQLITGRNKFNWRMGFSVIPFYFIFLVCLGWINPYYLFLVNILNLFKIYSLFKTFKLMASNLIEFQEKSRLLYGIIFFMTVLLFCSIIFFYAEIGVNPEVNNFEDSIWYVLQTITSIGYGDIIPSTHWGRLMGIIAMISAIGITSFITAVTTSSLVDSFRRERQELRSKGMERIQTLDNKLDKISDKLDDNNKIDDLIKEMGQIREEIENLKKKI